MLKDLLNYHQASKTSPIFEIQAFQPKNHIQPPRTALTSDMPLTRMAEDGEIPRPYRIMTDIQSINTCIHFNGAIDKSNALWVWGGHAYGITFDSYFSFDVLPDLEYCPQKLADNVVSCSMGALHLLYVTKDHRLWGWGDNQQAQLGVGNISSASESIHIMDDVISSYAGIFYSCAIRSDHSLWGWGSNIGNIMLTEQKYCSEPVHIMDDVVSFSSTGYTTYVIKSDGSLWGWGRDNSDQCFHLCPDKPRKVCDHVKKCVNDVDSANGFGFILLENGDLYSYGACVPGSLVTNRVQNKLGAEPIKVLEHVDDVACGKYYSLIKMQDGRMFSTGTNEYGQCGLGKCSDPFYKPKLAMYDVAEISAGHMHGMALQKNGDLWIWGHGYERAKNK